MITDSFKKDIVFALMKTSAGTLGKEKIGAAIELPPSPELGDYAFPCFLLARKLEKSPAEIAVLLQKEIRLPVFVEKAIAVNAYLNFFIRKEKLAGQVISGILKEKNFFGLSRRGKGKTIMIEYSQPNTNKPLHIGHLRNIALAMALGNLLEFSGFRVVRANLYNDRGIHICKSMLAYRKWGKGSQPDAKPDHFVGKFYVMFGQRETGELKQEIQALLQKWEKKDKETIRLWRKMNQWAIRGFKETYRRFGSRFDVEYFESRLYDKAMPVIQDGLKKGVFEKTSEGAIVCDLDKFGLGKKTILRADGTAIYITQDLALAIQKFREYRLDESLYVVGSEQNLYFRQLFRVFELLGFPWAAKCRHISYELVLLPGGKLKSREGRVVDADELMD